MGQRSPSMSRMNVNTSSCAKGRKALPSKFHDEDGPRTHSSRLSQTWVDRTLFNEECRTHCMQPYCLDTKSLANDDKRRIESIQSNRRSSVL